MSECPQCGEDFDRKLGKRTYALRADEGVSGAFLNEDVDRYCIFVNYIDVHEFSITVYLHGDSK